MVDVSNEKSAYSEAKYSRKMSRDAIKGGNAIKRGQTTYLPMPPGFMLQSYDPTYIYPQKQSDYDFSVPWAHENSSYSAYLQRARYPEICSVTRNGLVGTATKKRPICELPSAIDYLIEDAGRDGESIYEIFADSIVETLTVGNCFPVINIDAETNKLFFQIITAEQFIDWDESPNGDGLTFANIRRKSTSRNPDTFVVEDVVKNVVYHFSDSIPVVRLFSDDTEQGGELPLQLQGTVFDMLPIFPIGSQNNSATPQTAPLYGLAEIALNIYQMHADLRQAQFMTCNPNLCITGAEDDPESEGIPHIMGSQVVLMVSNADAKVFYPNTDTSALDHCRESVQDCFKEAAMYSVSIIGQEKKAAESEETVKMRQGAQNATLVKIVENCGKAISDALKFCARVSNSDESAVVFSANTDFAEKYISPQLLQALVTAWVARGLSIQTLLQNFKDAGILGKDDSIDDELTRIATEAPSV